jgi:hypothetical protein
MNAKCSRLFHHGKEIDAAGYEKSRIFGIFRQISKSNTRLKT